MGFKKVSLFLVFALLAGCAAPSANHAAPGPQTLNYLNEDMVAAIANAVPAPSPQNSPADKAQVAAVLAAQIARTPQECTRANTEATISTKAFFGPAYGPLTETEFDEVSPLLAKVMNDVYPVLKIAKHRFNLPRPFAEDSNIHPCVPLDPTSSYPSGHATSSRVFARVLDLLIPSKKSQFDRRAMDIAQDRVLGGVHRPSDILAGQNFGDQIFEAISKQQSFQSDVQSLRSSLHLQ